MRKWTTHLFDVIGMDGSVYFNNDHPICWPRPVCEDLLNKFAEELSDVSNLDKKPSLEGKNMFILLSSK